jgi:peptidoglycan hydrolase CwlO-like protein
MLIIILLFDSKLLIIFSNLSKNQPYLTFLNVPQLERQGTDLQTKIEELQIINQSLREKNDKMKEDVIANLSDKLIVLSERLKRRNMILVSRIKRILNIHLR